VKHIFCFFSSSLFSSTDKGAVVGRNLFLVC
jgi:hypothetical protein